MAESRIEFEGSTSPIAEELAQAMIGQGQAATFFGGKHIKNVDIHDDGDIGRLAIICDDGSAMIIEGRFAINLTDPGTFG
jgi:hypothetical protein